jgi:hypothetical protein
MVPSLHIFAGCSESPLLKERHKRRKEEEEEVGSYWMTLRKREDSGN